MVGRSSRTANGTSYCCGGAQQWHSAGRKQQIERSWRRQERRRRRSEGWPTGRQQQQWLEHVFADIKDTQLMTRHIAEIASIASRSIRAHSMYLPLSLSISLSLSRRRYAMSRLSAMSMMARGGAAATVAVRTESPSNDTRSSRNSSLSL